nr:hypothetical protein [Tanacetum cinerariifolium]
MQMQESKVVLGKAVDADLVVMDSSGTEFGKQDRSSSSGNYITHDVDADIKPVNDQVPFAKSYKVGKARYSFPRSSQNWRDLPRDGPLVSVEVLRRNADIRDLIDFDVSVSN